jgi:exosortase/archaeosortase family protein
MLSGSSAPFLNLGFIGLGLYLFWQDRTAMRQMRSSQEERWLGSFLILAGILLFPVMNAWLSLQAFIMMLIVLGICLGSWGRNFLRCYFLVILLLGVGIYPDLMFLAYLMQNMLMPEQWLENAMAWLGSLGLQALGQPATASQDLLQLPGGAVQIQPGCNGFDMAFILGATGFLIGTFFRRRWLETLTLIVMGVGLAFALNVPRIMLLAISSVYWGKASFEFWHGQIGGQIFAMILFTLYYYMAMAMVDQT